MASFEDQLAQLEQVVDRLETGGLPLEESVALFEDGMRLSKACKAQLSNAESRIQVLLQPEGRGKVRVEDLVVEVDVDEGDEDGDEEDRQREQMDDEE